MSGALHAPIEINRPRAGGTSESSPRPAAQTISAVRPAARRFAPHAPSQTDERLRQAWLEFKRTGSPAARNVLIIHYMCGHVRRLAQRLHAQLPPQIEVDDLVDEAYEGLVEAIERFNLDRDVRFETFSSKRLFGAMRDYLRRIDPIPRLARSRAKQIQALIEKHHLRHGHGPDAEELHRMLRLAALARFRKAFGREPEAPEHARLMKLADSSFRKSQREGRPALVVSFNSASGGDGTLGFAEGGERDAMASFEDHRRPSPLGRAELADLRRWVSEGFSRRDRLIIVLYYYEQMTMKEIGNTLGCSESRVSQRLDSILQCLRARLQRTGQVAEFYGK